MKRTRFLEDAYWGARNTILTRLMRIAEKNVLLRERSFAFSHSQGQTRKSALVTAMSAFPPIATKLRTSRHVGFVPLTDSCTAARHLVLVLPLDLNGNTVVIDLAGKNHQAATRDLLLAAHRRRTRLFAEAATSPNE